MSVRDFLRERLLLSGVVVNPELIERNGAVHGQNDKGDIRGVPGFVIECKNEASIDLPRYIREAKVEQHNAKAFFYAVVVKARRQSVDQSYVVMDLGQFTALLGWMTPRP